MTCNSRGAWLHEPRDLDGRARPRSTIAAVTRQPDPDDVRGPGLEALGSKPAGLLRQCLAQDSAGMSGLKRKTAMDGTPEPRNKRAQPTAGRQETTISRIKIPQTQCTQQDRGDARCDGTPSSHSSEQRTGADGPDSAQSSEGQQSQYIDESRSLSRRRGSPDSENRGDSSVQQRTVRMLQIQVPALRQSGEHSSCATNHFSGDTETDAVHQEDPEDR